MRLNCVLAALAGLLFGASPSQAAPVVKQVLLLQPFDRGNLVIDSFTGNFRVDLDQRSGRPVNVIQVPVGPTGFVGAPEQAIIEYIRSLFPSSPPDLIVALAGPATEFARAHRQQLFPGTPLLFAAVDQRFLHDAPLGDNETAVTVDNDYPRLVEDILRLLPQTRQVFMVMGSGRLGEFWHQQLEIDFRPFKDRLTFIWSEDLSLPEILRRCANLPPDSVIFFLAFGTDARGGAYADERVLADLHAAANAPLFNHQSALFGSGIVGGSMIPIEGASRQTADVAIRILNGEPANRTRSASLRPGAPMFDWRELEHWQIPESRLPAGSVVRYRRPSLWEEHRGTIVSALGALVVQSLLIVGLLYQRRARQRAETESRRNMALAADASRRETMSALTSSIGHELGQPLNAMMHNAQALRMMVDANRASPETIDEILGDLEHQSLNATQIIDRHRTMLRSRQLDKKAIDMHAVIGETMTLIAHDMDARQIKASVERPPVPCIVNGDQVLLQQVLVNLVMNAVEAMAETPPARRRITIRSELRAEQIDISVRDTGSGLPAHVNGTLFTPFVTTKANGLGIGLTIVRTIVEAHGGVIAAHNNEDGGATFTVTLRRSVGSANAQASRGAA